MHARKIRVLHHQLIVDPITAAALPNSIHKYTTLPCHLTGYLRPRSQGNVIGAICSATHQMHLQTQWSTYTKTHRLWHQSAKTGGPPSQLSYCRHQTPNNRSMRCKHICHTHTAQPSRLSAVLS